MYTSLFVKVMETTTTATMMKWRIELIHKLTRQTDPQQTTSGGLGRPSQRCSR